MANRLTSSRRAGTATAKRARKRSSTASGYKREIKPGAVSKNRVVPMATPAERESAVLYLYGISGKKPGNMHLPEGVDGLSAVESFDCAGLTCWASRVNPVDFADRLAENMENLEWLAATSVRHQRVVAAIAAATDVLPARFGTVFRGQRSLRADVQSRKRSLLRSLDRIADAEEWGVKVFVADKRPKPAISARSGKEYLQRKATLQESQARHEADDEVKALAHELRRTAVDMAGNGKVSGGQRGLQWQASFLVRREHREQFQQVLRRFAVRWQDSRRIECTGPWPAYSFVSAYGE